MAVSATQVASAGVASIVADAVSQGGQAMRRIFPTVLSLCLVWALRPSASDDDNTRIDVIELKNLAYNIRRLVQLEGHTLAVAA
jgi:hypothetical protein